MDTLAALLLTDLVDSAALSQQLGDDAMGSVWAAHDRSARDLLLAWRGREIDKSDGFLLLFEHVRDALSYALDYHRALAGLEADLQARHPGLRLRARAGLHVGPVTLRETPSADVALGAKPLEVDGVSKPVAARVMAAAMGRQTLLTRQALDALGDLPQRVVAHGHWRIKGLPEPVALFEVGEADAPFLPPPDTEKAYRVVQSDELWLPVREMRHSLPAERNAFVGRGILLRELSQRLDRGTRLISLLGLGGCGKTRVAVRFGWVVLGDFPGGVWFCDLAPARGVDGVVGAVAQGLDVPLGKDDPVAHLARAIVGRGRCLLILDNFEHLARHAEATLGRWLEQAPQASFLVTTREVLGIPGEETLAVPPLRQSDAERLFLRRAAAAKHDFAPAGDELAAVRTLVQLLDGLPLAIELAAARVRTLSPRAMLARMNERFKLLTSSGGRRDRQSTLRAAFDWSWDLLAPAEKSALAQLSVFEGGFTLEAAEAVLDLSHLADAPWTTDVVAALVDKSFVRPLAGERCDLLVTVQAYAAERLAEPQGSAWGGPQARAEAELRHARWFAALGPERATESACADLDNLLLACSRSVASAEPALAADALAGAWAAISLRGPLSAGLQAAEAVCAMPGLTGAAATVAQAVLAQALEACGHRERTEACLELALALARAHGLPQQEGELLVQRGGSRGGRGRTDVAHADLDLALEIGQRLQAPRLQVRALNELGTLEFEAGNASAARRHYLEGLRLATVRGDQRWQATLLGNLGSLEATDGQLEQALAQFQQALAMSGALGDRQREGVWLANLGMLHYLRGSLEESQGCSEAALAHAVQLGFVRLEAVARANLALPLVELGALEAARHQAEAALAIARQLDQRRIEAQVAAELAAVLARLGRWAQALQALAETDAAVPAVLDREGQAVVLCRRAECLLLAGRAEEGQAALHEARSAVAACGSARQSEPGRALSRLEQCLATPRAPAASAPAGASAPATAPTVQAGLG